MKAYDIIKFDEDYRYLVFATSYENPIDYLDDIEDELRIEMYSGKILFDLLLCNGMSSNRYIEIEFDGQYFDLCTSKELKTPSKLIERYAYDYLKDKPLLVQNSVLPNAQCYLIQNGML